MLFQIIGALTTGIAGIGGVAAWNWLDRSNRASVRRHYAHMRHAAVVARERASGVYTHDASITDIVPTSYKAG